MEVSWSLQPMTNVNWREGMVVRGSLADQCACN